MIHATYIILQVRQRIMRFFNADPTDWQLVFTRSATGALQLVSTEATEVTE